MPIPQAIQVPVIDWNDFAVEWLPQEHRTPRFIAWQQGMIGQVAWLNKNFWNYCYGDENSNPWSSVVTYGLNDTVVTFQGVFISTTVTNLSNNPPVTPKWIPSTSYSVGFCVLYLGVNYQCLTSNSDAVFNSIKWLQLGGSAWYQISPTYIGAQERIQYSSQKLVMEYALNRWFRTNFKQPTALTDGSTTGQWYTPLSDIWIQTKNFSFASFGVCSIGQEEGAVGASAGIFGVCSTSITLTSTTYEYIIWIPTGLATALGASYITIVSAIVNKMSVLGTTYQISTY